MILVLIAFIRTTRTCSCFRLNLKSRYCRVADGFLLVLLIFAPFPCCNLLRATNHGSLGVLNLAACCPFWRKATIVKFIHRRWWRVWCHRLNLSLN
ncbi:hypothetical protein BJX99DRAFT_228732 [Aspergillus californicus]